MLILFALAAGLVLANESCKHTPLDFIDDINDPVIDDTTGGGGDTIDFSNCDPDTVYFENDVFPIIISNCAISGCHDNITHEEGINLSSYTKIKSSGILDLTDPWDSDLIEQITKTGSDRMPPPPMPQLTDAQIDILLQWQIQGALNNACTECDTAAVTYALSIDPIMSAYCIGCHDHASPSGGIDLTAYYGTGTNEGVYDVAADGRLYGAVTFALGYSAMPQGGTPIPDCLIDQIRIWIEDGYPDN